MKDPTIRFGYDGDWVPRVSAGRVGKVERPAGEGFAPVPADCKPWVDGQIGAWDLAFPFDVSYSIVDGKIVLEEAMRGRMDSFARGYLGVYTGVRISTSRGWSILIEPPNGKLPYAIERAVIETDWYPWLKNFVVIKPDLLGPPHVFMQRGAPLCRVRMVPRRDLVIEEAFDGELFEQALGDYNRRELELRDAGRFRGEGEKTFYPLYKMRSERFRREQ